MNSVQANNVKCFKLSHMNDRNYKIRPIRHGASLVAGGAIGAGMFALPLAAASAWTLWALFGLVVVCCLTIVAASILLDVHKRFELGASFHSLVLKTFGPMLAWLNNVSIIFIMLILMYAYVTAGGRILKSQWLGEFGYLSSLFFATSVAIIVWLGATLVSRLSMIFIVIMAVSFIVVMMSLTAQMNVASLLIVDAGAGAEALWLAIPVFVAAFACGGIVPSLVDYYRGDIVRARKSVVRGVLLSLLVYLVWVFGCFALLGQSKLSELADQGAGLAELLTALKSIGGKDYIIWLLNWFSHFAVITSFFSIALGLVHFLMDRFSLEHNIVNRLIATLIAFIPPTVASLVAPYGFVTAIAYAGFFVAISFFIVPALLYAKHYQWNLKSGVVMLAGLTVIVLKGWKYVL